ncbi:MAG: type II secretion system protein GspG [Pyrinomonadaceae bacterium]|nr:type II secretion system protein GspG [Phycisphaerales bacterium]
MNVIVIIRAILGLVTVNLMGAKKKADTGVTQMSLGTLKNALEAFSLDFNRYPAEDGEGLVALWNKSVLPEEEQSKWQEGGYTKEAMPRDQWGSEWGYRLTIADGTEGSTSGFTVWSNGPDKQEGTADDVYPGNKKPDESGGTSPDDVGPPPTTGN